MKTYILRRFLYMIPILFGVMLIGFLLFHVVGGNPVYLMLGNHASPELIAELEEELGLNKPLAAQFVDYVVQVFTFDYGLSYSTRQPVVEMITEGAGPSLLLSSVAFMLTLVLGLGLALTVSYFRGSWIDRVVVVLCVSGMSISSLAFILFGMYFFGFYLDWFPIHGYGDSFTERIEHIMLPALIWVAVSLGVDVRFFRTAILDEVNQDYVRTARAKGLPEKIVFVKHVLKNSLIPILTHVVIQIPFLILGSLLLEQFFGIPGLGSLVVTALSNTDWPVLKAVFPLFTILFMIGQTLTDILYKVVDPRVSIS